MVKRLFISCQLFAAGNPVSAVMLAASAPVSCQLFAAGNLISAVMLAAGAPVSCQLFAAAI